MGILSTHFKVWMSIRSGKVVILSIAGLLIVSPSMVLSKVSFATTQQSSGSVGIQGIIPSTPPARGATISVPTNGNAFTSLPITVSGICPAGLLIKVFDNNVFVGSTICTTGGSYTLQIALFSGLNDLIAKDYDSLDQTGPDSNTVTVSYTNGQLSQFGSQITLGSVYAERGAPPGSELDWPIILSGGNGPYAISIDWGDGSPQTLLSQTYPGSIILKHVYAVAGLYRVIIKATDKNGSQAFLQVVGQATGAVQSNNSKNSDTPNLIVQRSVEWWPALALLPLILISFWLGKKHQLYKIRHRTN